MMTRNKFYEYTHKNGISFGEYEKQLQADWANIEETSIMVGAELELLYENLTMQPVTDEVKQAIAEMMPEILMNLYCNYVFIAIKEQEKNKQEKSKKLPDYLRYYGDPSEEGLDGYDTFGVPHDND